MNSTASPIPTGIPAFLSGDGEMRQLIRTFNWSATSIGAIEQWPVSLRTLINMLLTSRFPMLLFWGPDLLTFYNDAFRPSLGNNGKHPSSLGQKGQDSWAESWPTVGPMIHDIVTGGDSVWFEDQKLPIYREGKIDYAYWTYSFSPVTDDSNAVAGILVTCAETTDVVEGMQQLEKSENRFQNLVREATMGIIVLIGKQMKVEIVNDAYARLIDRSTEDLIGKELFEVIPEAKDDFLPILERVRSSGESIYLYDTPYFVWVNGERKEGFLHLVYQPYKEIDGATSGVMVLCQDVTESVKARTALEESERRFRLLANEMPQFVWTCDASGTLNYFNQAAYIFSGLTEAEALNGGWIDIVHPDDRQENARLWQLAVASGTDFNFEHRFRSADGQYRWQLSRATPQRDANNIIHQWIGTSTDIQDQKTIEERLENIVAQRTKQLNELNLQLMKSNDDLQQFAHVASHDLKEPLRKIKTFGGRLINEHAQELSGPAKFYISKIESASNRMYAMIDGVLLYSTVTGVEQAAELISLGDILQNIEQDLELVIQQKRAIISYSGLPTIQGSAILIHQLFYNLINNSLKFSKKDIPPVIQISSDMAFDGVSGNAASARIIVQDNGIGFGQKDAENIFKTFSRLNSKDKYEGTGLGLALCKKIAERHHGRISAQGIPDKGARFEIILPLLQNKI